MASPGRLNPQDLWTLARNFNYSNWLLLNYLASNLDPSVFRGLFADIATEIRTRISSSSVGLSIEEEENSENETLDQDNGMLMKILTTNRSNKQE